jgi:putative transposase
MRAAFSLETDKGRKKLKQLTKWLEQEFPPASHSLLGGPDEMFTVNRLRLPKTLRRCLGSTGVIEWRNSGIPGQTRLVKKWRYHGMVVRWVAGWGDMTYMSERKLSEDVKISVS